MHGWEGETNYVFRTNGNCQNHPWKLCFGFRWQFFFFSSDAYFFLTIFMFCWCCYYTVFQVSMANALPCHINLVGYIQVKMEAIAFCRLLTLSGADKQQRRPCPRILTRPPHKKRDQREETNLINQFPGSSEHALRLHPASLRLFLSSFLAPLI